jgi:uncharacterized protein YkwD
MNSPLLRSLCGLIILLCGLRTAQCHADPVAAVQLLRLSGCAGVLPAMQPLRHNRQLDRAAELWAAGSAPATAAVRSGYPATAAVGLRMRGSDDAILQALRQTRCRAVADQSLRDVGVYHTAGQTWMVLAAVRPIAAALTPQTSRSDSGARVLQLVNAVRASGTRCGGEPYGPAPSLRLSGTLSGVAADHALDMARHDYFEHVDLAGHTPADRVRATGYREKLVGENIAYGPTTDEEVVAGWLHSTGHCQNIMDPRFVEMGLAVAPGQGSRRGVYWDQLLAAPAR